jgi:hypothetical protein
MFTGTSRPGVSVSKLMGIKPSGFCFADMKKKADYVEYSCEFTGKHRMPFRVTQNLQQKDPPNLI